MQQPEDDVFINIHSHKESNDIGEFALLNIFAQDLPKLKLNDNLIYSVGLHPWHVADDIISPSITEIERAAKHSAVFAIGETGLDRVIETPLELQLKAFILQLEIAEDYKKPVMIHCVRSFSEMIALRKHRKFSVPWIFHGFTGNNQIARQLIDFNCYLSFGKFLLNSKSKIPALFSLIPDESIFLEIDDSNFTIGKVYDQACALKKYSRGKMRRIILNNFNRCFFNEKYK